MKKKWSFNEWIANFLESSDVYLDAFEPDDYDAADEHTPGGDWGYDEFDEGILDSLVILGLAATLAFLVIYRQQRQIRNRREQERQQQQQQQGQNGNDAAQEQEQNADDGRGLFPRPGDPDLNQWMAGGVGH